MALIYLNREEQRVIKSIKSNLWETGLRLACSCRQIAICMLVKQLMLLVKNYFATYIAVCLMCTKMVVLGQGFILIICRYIKAKY